MQLRDLYLLLLAAALAACTGQSASSDEELETENAVYYWRTEWRLDSAEQAFLGHYSIGRVFCRYFDVVMNSEGTASVPNATIAFREKVPQGIELVPTVYITEDCMHQQHDSLARQVVRRVRQMNSTNDLPEPRELQVDCDYTDRSRTTYYRFLSQVRREAQCHGMRLSTTIRLHQLAMTPPPADYGVLMLYNTGDPRRFAERNPVLDRRDVRPYLGLLADYRLPLAAAYPTYCWHRHISGVSIDHSVTAEELLHVKQAVEQKRPALSRTILTYCLDKENIERYQPETYEAIYRH